MFPLNDTESSRYSQFPYMTLFLIAANVFITLYVFMAYLAGTDYELFAMFGTTPLLIWQQQGGNGITAVTHMFLHGGLMHLLGNMFALWVFGRRVEDLTGPWRFLAFYLVCGMSANIVNSIIYANSDIPGIGASGALFGIMAAYLVLFPKGRIRVFFFFWFLPIFNIGLLNAVWFFASLLAIGLYSTLSDKNIYRSIFSLYFPTPRAYLVILYLVLLEVPRALSVLVFEYDSGIGHWAHLGGFVGGAFIFLFLRSDAFHRYRNELPL